MHSSPLDDFAPELFLHLMLLFNEAVSSVQEELYCFPYGLNLCQLITTMSVGAQFNYMLALSLLIGPHYVEG